MSTVETGRLREIPGRAIRTILDFYNLHFGKAGISIHEIQNDQQEALLPGLKGRKRVSYKTRGGRILKSPIIDLSNTAEVRQEGPIDPIKLLDEINQLAAYPSYPCHPKRYYK